MSRKTQKGKSVISTGDNVRFTLYIGAFPFLTTVHFLCSGNCGVYTLKYIEWLVFGGEFKLEESNMQAYREKMAIEFFNKTWVLEG